MNKEGRGKLEKKKRKKEYKRKNKNKESEKSKGKEIPGLWSNRDLTHCHKQIHYACGVTNVAAVMQSSSCVKLANNLMPDFKLRPVGEAALLVARQLLVCITDSWV